MIRKLYNLNLFFFVILIFLRKKIFKWQKFANKKQLKTLSHFFRFMGEDCKQLYYMTWMWEILLLLHLCPNMGFRVNDSNRLPKPIQWGQQDRKWVRKPRVSWKNVETLKSEASKQAATTVLRTFACTYS